MVSRRVAPSIAAVGGDTPITDVPLVQTNPFDFSATTMPDLRNHYIWRKLMFDRGLLPGNPFYLDDGSLYPGREFFQPRPLGPPGGARMVPPFSW